MNTLPESEARVVVRALSLWTLAGAVLVGVALLVWAGPGASRADAPLHRPVTPASPISSTGEVDLSRIGVTTEAIPTGTGADASDLPGASIAAYER